MKIGLDIDGVLTIPDHLEYFKDLATKHEVHLITARDPKDATGTIAEMKRIGINYSTLNFFNHDQDGEVEAQKMNSGATLWYVPGGFLKAKSFIAKELEVERMYDDWLEFLVYMRDIECIWVKGDKFTSLAENKKEALIQKIVEREDLNRQATWC